MGAEFSADELDLTDIYHLTKKGHVGDHRNYMGLYIKEVEPGKDGESRYRLITDIKTLGTVHLRKLIEPQQDYGTWAVGAAMGNGGGDLKLKTRGKNLDDPEAATPEGGWLYLDANKKWCEDATLNCRKLSPREIAQNEVVTDIYWHKQQQIEQEQWRKQQDKRQHPDWTDHAVIEKKFYCLQLSGAARHQYLLGLYTLDKSVSEKYPRYFFANSSDALELMLYRTEGGHWAVGPPPESGLAPLMQTREAELEHPLANLRGGMAKAPNQWCAPDEDGEFEIPVKLVFTIPALNRGQAGSIAKKTRRQARRSSTGSKRSPRSGGTPRTTPSSHASTQSPLSSARSSGSNGMRLLRIDSSVIADVPPEQWKSRTREAEDNLRRLQQQQQRRQQQRTAESPKSARPVSSDVSPFSAFSSDSEWARALQEQVDRKRRLTLDEHERAMAEVRSKAMTSTAERKACMEARLVAMPHHFRKHLMFTAMRRFVAIQRTERDRDCQPVKVAVAWIILRQLQNAKRMREQREGMASEERSSTSPTTHESADTGQNDIRVHFEEYKAEEKKEFASLADHERQFRIFKINFCYDGREQKQTEAFEDDYDDFFGAASLPSTQPTATPDAGSTASTPDSTHTTTPHTTTPHTTTPQSANPDITTPTPTPKTVTRSATPTTSSPSPHGDSAGPDSFSSDGEDEAVTGALREGWARAVARRQTMLQQRQLANSAQVVVASAPYKQPSQTASKGPPSAASAVTRADDKSRVTARLHALEPPPSSATPEEMNASATAAFAALQHVKQVTLKGCRSPLTGLMGRYVRELTSFESLLPPTTSEENDQEVLYSWTNGQQVDQDASESQSTVVPSFVSHIRILTDTGEGESVTGIHANRRSQKGEVTQLGKDPLLEIKFAVPKQPNRFTRSSAKGPKPLQWVYADDVTYAAILVDDKIQDIARISAGDQEPCTRIRLRNDTIGFFDFWERIDEDLHIGTGALIKLIDVMSRQNAKEKFVPGKMVLAKWRMSHENAVTGLNNVAAWLNTSRLRDRRIAAILELDKAKQQTFEYELDKLRRRKLSIRLCHTRAEAENQEGSSAEIRFRLQKAFEGYPRVLLRYLRGQDKWVVAPDLNSWRQRVATLRGTDNIAEPAWLQVSTEGLVGSESEWHSFDYAAGGWAPQSSLSSSLQSSSVHLYSATDEQTVSDLDAMAMRMLAVGDYFRIARAPGMHPALFDRPSDQRWPWTPGFVASIQAVELSGARHEYKHLMGYYVLCGFFEGQAMYRQHDSSIRQGPVALLFSGRYDGSWVVGPSATSRGKSDHNLFDLAPATRNEGWLRTRWAGLPSPAAATADSMRGLGSAWQAWRSHNTATRRAGAWEPAHEVVCKAVKGSVCSGKKGLCKQCQRNQMPCPVQLSDTYYQYVKAQVKIRNAKIRALEQ